MTDYADLDEVDLDRLREAIGVSQSAREHGNHPFGAVLTDESGTVVLRAENTVVTENDVTGHAETNLVRLASGAYPTSLLRTFTLYTSCEPCAMCSGAIYWAGIGRVVYAMSETDLIGMTGSHPENPTLALPCREVFAAGQRETVVAGPALGDEARPAHEGFWEA